MNQAKWILALVAGVIAITLGSFFAILVLILITFPGVSEILIFTPGAVLQLVLLGIGFIGSILAGSFACMRPKLKFGKYDNNLPAMISLIVSSAIVCVAYIIGLAIFQAFLFCIPLVLSIVSLAMRHPQNSHETQFESVMNEPLSEEEKIRQERISETLKQQTSIQPNDSAGFISIETTRKLIALQKLLNDGTITQQEYNNLYSSYINNQQ